MKLIHTDKGNIVKELERKYYIRNLSCTLNKLQQRGFAEIIRDENKKNLAIQSFKLNF